MKLECGNSMIEARIDTGADVSVVKSDLISPELLEECESVDEILVRGAFGQQVYCSLVRLPFRIFNSGNSDQITNILCAVTDKLDDEEMLLSGHDYAVLLDNCRKDRSVLIPEDDYSSVLPFLETILEEDEFVDEDEDVVDLSSLYRTDVNNEVEQSFIINQVDSIVEVKHDVVDVNDELVKIQSDQDKSEFASIQRNDETLSNCFKEAEKVGGQFF